MHMKKLLLLVVLLGLAALGATAQETVNFSDLPDMDNPSPIPNGYGNVTWSGFYFVDPFDWGGSGQGFKHAPIGRDVGFSPLACNGSLCSASLSSTTGFQLVSAHAAAGYSKNPLVVTAYNHGRYVGVQTYMMTTDEQELDFPPAC